MFDKPLNRSEPLQDLLDAAGNGDHSAFERLYARTEVHLFSIAQRMLKGQHAAEDVLQEAYVNIWKSAHTYRADSVTAPHISGDGHVMAWLIAVVRNKSLDALRSRTRRKEEPLPDANLFGDDNTAMQGNGSAASALEQLSQASQAAQVEHCMTALPGSHRQCVALAYYQGLSHSEVALRMGAPLGSVKAWIRRGLSKLKDCLDTRSSFDATL